MPPFRPIPDLRLRVALLLLALPLTLSSLVGLILVTRHHKEVWPSIAATGLSSTSAHLSMCLEQSDRLYGRGFNIAPEVHPLLSAAPPHSALRTGLGLAISSVHPHSGGPTEVEWSDGAGSTVNVALPAVDSP